MMIKTVSFDLVRRGGKYDVIKNKHLASGAIHTSKTITLAQSKSDALSKMAAEAANSQTTEYDIDSHVIVFDDQGNVLETFEMSNLNVH